MGLSNFNKYRLSQHAIDRYRERFNPSTSEAAITSKVRSWLSQADFLSDEQLGRQAWFNNEDSVVIIVKPKNFTVITLYSTLSEYNNRAEANQGVQETTSDIHPYVKTMVSELVESKVFNIKSTYYEKLSALYADYADRMDKLSRTMKQEKFIEKGKEMAEVKVEIEKLEAEFEYVIESMEFYIQKKPSQQ